MKVRLLEEECRGRVVTIPDHHACLLIAQGKAIEVTDGKPAKVAQVISGDVSVVTKVTTEAKPKKRRKRKGSTK